VAILRAVFGGLVCEAIEALLRALRPLHQCHRRSHGRARPAAFPLRARRGLLGANSPCSRRSGAVNPARV
jgi:hypothetical protein